MSVQVVDLPVPSSDGVGAAQDVSALGAIKTVIISGSFEASIIIEAAGPTGDFAQVAVVRAAKTVPLTLVASRMRVRVSGKNPFATYTPNVDVAAEEGLVTFASLPVTSVDGVGASVDVSTVPSAYRTAYVVGAFSGSIILEGSQDGTDWAQVGTSFTGGGAIQINQPIAQLRTRREGINPFAPGAPLVFVGGEGGPGSAQPAFPSSLQTIFIYARPAGSDETGTGSLANPYATFQRAIRDVPPIVPAGTIYRVDITGIDEKLPDNYEFPIIKGAEGIGDFDFSQQWFHYFGICNVQATPTLLDTIASGTEVITNDPESDLISVQVVPSPGWTVNEFQGKLAVCPFAASRNSVIVSNTADTIKITRGETPPLFPLSIMDYGARLHADFVVNGPIHGTAINIRSSVVSLLGIKVEVDLGNPGNPNDVNLCLSVMGDVGPLSFQMCHLAGAQFQTDLWSRIRQCYMPDFFSIGLPGLVIQSYLHNSAEPFGAGNGQFSPFPADWGSSFYLIESVLEGITPFAPGDTIEEFNPAASLTVVMRRFEILNPVADPVGTNTGIRVAGPNWTISGGKVDGAGGDGISVLRGGFAQISNVGGSGNGGVGVRIQDGCQVQFLDDPAGPHYPPAGGTVLNGTSITGAGGDLKVGDRAAAVWATLAAASPWNIIDVPAVAGGDPPAGTDTGTLSRAYGTTK